MRIRLINCYFGSRPAWWDAFLLSCERNSSIEFLLLSDCVSDCALPRNVKGVNYTLAELNRAASSALNISVRKGPYSQVDLKPAYGLIFPDYVAGAEFWGHYDLDLIWGDVRHFITDDILSSNNIISGRKGETSGHFTIFRNDPETNGLILNDPEHKSVLEDPGVFGYDEKGFSSFLRSSNYQKVYWDQQLVVGKKELAEQPDGWQWRDGHLYDLNGQERMYIHFMKWKPYMRRTDFRFMEGPEDFRITRRRTYAHGIGPFDRFLNAWPVDVALHGRVRRLQECAKSARRKLRRSTKSIRRTLAK